METIPVAPVGSVVAPTAIADHGTKKRRKREEDDHHNARASDDSEQHGGKQHGEAPHGEIRRDEDGHIDCYG